MFSREDLRDKETRSLVFKLVAKELVEIKKAEEKEKVKGKELKPQAIAIFEEAKTNTNSGASVSSN